MTINPYQGCQHRCGYCYATYEWSPRFYDRIYAKSNAAEILERELASWKESTISPVMVSSATDAYQPAELRYGLTRKCIEILQKYNVPYYLFTKSVIIERDLELHAKYKNCFIVWSITSCNERIRRAIEPGTPPSAKIFNTIQKFSRAGVTCGVNVDPIMPLITDEDKELGEIVQACKPAGVQHVFGAMLRLRQDIWERMKAVFTLLGIGGGIERYKELYAIKEPVRENYLVCDRKYERQVLDRLKRMVLESSISADFPQHMRDGAIYRLHGGQQSILNYVTG